MNDALVAMWLSIALVLQVIAILVAFVYVFADHKSNLHIMLKVGFATMVFGLVVQIVRSLHYLDYGYYPIDKFFPLWLSKDIGAMILIFYFAAIHPKVIQKR